MSEMQEVKSRNRESGTTLPIDDIPLLKMEHALARIAEWSKEYPIFATLQSRTGALSPALREFGAMCRRAENYELATEVFLVAISMRSDDSWLWRNLSAVYQAAVQDELAEKCIRAALDLYENDARAWVQYAILLQKRDQAESAEAAFHRAFALDPKQFEACFGLGLLCLDKCRFGEAVDFFQRCLDHAPNDRLSQACLGYVLHMTCEYSESARSYQAAAATEPLERVRLLREAFAALAEDRIDEALKVYTSLIDDNIGYFGGRIEIASGSIDDR